MVTPSDHHARRLSFSTFYQHVARWNPTTFAAVTQDDVLASSVQARHNKGCNCKKSGCLKKYCECFQAGIVCSDICKCVDCKNFEVRFTAVCESDLRCLLCCCRSRRRLGKSPRDNTNPTQTQQRISHFV